MKRLKEEKLMLHIVSNQEAVSAREEFGWGIYRKEGLFVEDGREFKPRWKRNACRGRSVHDVSGPGSC